MNLRSTWFPAARPREGAGRRVFALPYAGAGASIYHGWSKALAPADIDFISVQLPGRENRLGEPAIDRLPVLVMELAAAIHPLLDRPFALFGHSMGGHIAFELARALSAAGGAGFLQHLFVSAALPPHQPRTGASLHGLDEPAFLDEVSRRYGPLPRVVFESQELRAIVLPALRADLAMIETYDYVDGSPLDCALTVLGAREDHLVPEQSLGEWGRHTSGPFAVHVFDGDHFFVKTSAARIQSVLLAS